MLLYDIIVSYHCNYSRLNITSIKSCPPSLCGAVATPSFETPRKMLSSSAELTQRKSTNRGKS